MYIDLDKIDYDCIAPDPEPDIPQEILERLGEKYVLNIGPINQRMVKEIINYLDMGVKPEVIELAINETGLAPRPSARYLLAILFNCVKDGAKTREDWYKRQGRFYRRI